MAVIDYHNSSSANTPQDNGQAGFTLVEILCVLALLGLTAGLVVLNLPKPAPKFQTEVQSVAALINLAARQSVIDGKTRGIDVSIGRLEIFEYDGEWIAEHQRDFTDVSDLDFIVEEQEIDLPARERIKEKTDLPPLVFFDATGNVTPFTLSLTGREQSITLGPDARGRIVVETAP